MANEDVDANRLQGWASRGGSPEGPPRTRIPGDIWYVSNSILGIPDVSTDFHPAVVYSEGYVLAGSHDGRKKTWGKDAQLVRLDSRDLLPVPVGASLDGHKTYFNVSDLVPVPSGTRLGRFVGRLHPTVWASLKKRVDARSDF